MIKKLFYRIYQKTLYVLTLFMPIPKPKTFRGVDAYLNLSKIINNNQKVLIVTDKFIDNHPTTQKIKELFNLQKIDFIVYNQTTPDPKISDVEKATNIYLNNKCDVLLAIGGGSVIDLAKGIGIKVVRPNKELTKLAGILKVRKKLPLLIAIPTTVGTGSEATLACVLTNGQTNHKFAIMDHKLVPKYAILEFSYVYSLPQNLIAHTALDALTHAIEAYIGKANTKSTKKDALIAINIITRHLISAYNGNNDSKEQLLEASYLAGKAFTRAYVGNIHAIAHTLGGFYNIEHGLANAVVLPHVLKYYDKKIYKKLSNIYQYVSGKTLMSRKEEAIYVINEINKTLTILNIPNNFCDIIKLEDQKLLVKTAMKEANPLYPVPVIFNENDFNNIYNKLRNGDKKKWN